MSTHPITPGTPAPHPTLAQLVEGLLERIWKAIPSDPVPCTKEEIGAILLDVLSPELERMGRELVEAQQRETEAIGALGGTDEIIATLRTENERLTRERLTLQEELGLKLAACDCAAIMDTEESHAKNKDVAPGNPSWSPAFDSVMRRTSECIALRTRLRELEEDKKLWEWAATHPEDTFGAFCDWWATAGTGGRETRFEFRNIVKMGRDSARKEAP